MDIINFIDKNQKRNIMNNKSRLYSKMPKHTECLICYIQV